MTRYQKLMTPVLANGLTERQQKILDFIKAYMAKEGRPPTVRATMKFTGATSTNGVMCHLRALEKKGFLKQSGPGKSCSRVPVVEPGCCHACGQKLPNHS